MGFTYSASPDVPNGRIYGLPADNAASAGLRAAYAAAALAGLTANGVTFNDTGTAARLYRGAPDSYDNTPSNNLQFPQERYMANAFAHFDLSDKLTAFSEFHYSRNTVAGTIAPANYNAPFLIDVDNPYVSTGLRNVLRVVDGAETGARTVSHGAGSFTTTPGDGRAVVSIGRRFAELESRRSINTRDMFRMSVGARGKLGDVSPSFLTDLGFEAYYTYSDAKETILVTDGVSKSRLQQSILSQGGAAPVCNLFGQNMSPTCINAVAVDATALNKASLQVAQANVTGTLLTLPAGPAGFSLGVEWRKTSASFIPNADLQSGDVAGYTATLPTRGSVDVKEVFGEIRLPLIHDTPLIDLLALNAGFRGSDYSLSGIGTVWTYFAGADWRVTRGLAFRGQYQRAIRAPSVGELYGGQTVNSVGASDPCSSRLPVEQQTAQVRALCIATGVPAALVFSPVVQPAGFIYTINGGNPDLAAEKADTYTAGLVFSPGFIPRLDVSVDYFDINVDGAIGQLGGGLQNVLNLCYYTVQAADSVYCRAVPRSNITGEVLDSNPARVLAGNTGGLRTRGIDLALRYSVPLDVSLPGMGESSTLSLRSNYSYLLEYTSVPVQDLPAVRNECAGAFGGVCGDLKPRVRGSSRMTWSTDVLNFSLRHRYIGPVTRDTYLVPLRRGSATVPRLDMLSYPRMKAQNYFDLAADLKVDDAFTIYGGVNNVFNRLPPISYGTYDQIGTEIFLGVNVKM